MSKASRKSPDVYNIPEARFTPKIWAELMKRTKEKYGDKRVPIRQVFKENPDWVKELSLSEDEFFGSMEETDAFEVDVVTKDAMAKRVREKLKGTDDKELPV